MKKIFILIMLLVLIISGCGSTEESSESNSQPKSDTESVKDKDTELLTKEQLIQLYTDPEKFKGDKVDFFAKIAFPVEKDEEGTYIQAYNDPDNYERNTVIGIDDPNLDVQEGDIIHVIGKVEGKFDGENMMGADLTLPMVVASKIEKTDYATAFAPAIQTIEVNEEKDQHGYKMKISKIEIAKNETRVYMEIKNETDSNISFYGFDTKIVQENSQYEAEDNFEAEYPEVQSDILPGITTNGIVVFPAIDSEMGELKLISEGSSDNYDLDFQSFTFDITW